MRFSSRLMVTIARRSFEHFLQYAAQATTPFAGRQYRRQFRHCGKLNVRFEDLRLIYRFATFIPIQEQNVNTLSPYVKGLLFSCHLFVEVAVRNQYLEDLSKTYAPLNSG